MSDSEGTSHLDDFLPLSRVDFLVLLVLTDGDRHGYGIVMEIGERTRGRIQLLPGNLYSVMNRLMKWGLIERALEDPERDPENRRRRYYRITPLGRRALAAEASELRTLVQEAAARDLLETETPT